MFRLLAIAVGLSPFVVLELSLRAVGWQPDVPVGDPFVDFQNVRPLFVPSNDGRRMVTAANRLEYFRPETFAAKKAPNEFRIVCLGGSTVQGRPYAIETSFTTWLELSLTAADPTKQWEVINCGGVSYASYRLVPILKEMLRYDPDLIILYTGHNEFLEDRSYSAIKNAPKFVAHAYGSLAHLRTLQLGHQLIAGTGETPNRLDDRPVLSTEVDALLDYRGGLADYHRDAAWRQSVVKHFQYNLGRMVHLAKSAGVPIMLVDPPANLRDCPPFKVEDTAGITKAELATCERLVREAKGTTATDHRPAIELFEQAVAINPKHAGLHFELGRRYAGVRQFKPAQRHLLRAKEEDICPLRIIEPINQVIRQVANEAECTLVEVRRRFELLSEGGIPGDNLFVDHIHPTFRGHQIIADEIMTELQALNIVRPTTAWKDRRDPLYRQHWKSLDLVYFERGQQRLEGLRKWSQGRANKLRKGQEAETAEDSALPSKAAIEQWHWHDEFDQPIAQFKTVFWDSRDSDTLLPLLERELKGKSKTVLEIGTGTGWLALHCLNKGAAFAVATDINPVAVANARYNAERFGLSKLLDVRLVPMDDSSAFAVIGESERFDLILSNPPWENREPSAIDEYALYDPGFELLDSLLKDLRQHLKPGGKALLAYGSVEGIRQVQQLAPTYGLSARLLDRRDLAKLPPVFVPAVVIEVVPLDLQQEK